MAKKQKVEQFDYLSYFEDNLKITHPVDGLVPFRLWLAQLKVHNTLELQRKAGLPMRGNVLKARREGVSSYTGGRYFIETNVKPDKFAVICSATSEATDKIFKMAKTFEAHLPKRLKKPLKYSSRKEICYDEPHRSELRAQTAGAEALGRGGLTHYAHFSEVAFWDNARTQLVGALQEVPDKPDTIIIRESTANGQDAYWYEEYIDSVESWKNTKNLNNYLPIFLPWFIFPDYQLKIPEGVRFETGRPHAADIDLAWCEPEQELVAKYNLCNEQLFWRRWAIKNKCDSDLRLFCQEYPANYLEAFQASGRSVFSQMQLNSLSERCKPGRRLLFERISEIDEVRIVDVGRASDCWEVWQLPRPDCQYALGADVSEGIISDRKDEKSEPDYHGAVVLNRNTGLVAAIFHGRCDTDFFGKQCVLGSKYYNNAWSSPEINSAGLVVLNSYKNAGYEKIYQRQKHDEYWAEDDAPQLGWRTTPLTRRWLIETLRNAVRDGSVITLSSKLIGEMRTFVYGKDGKAQHAPGKHDDLLFGLGIALQLHQRCSLDDEPYPVGFTGAKMPDEDKPLTMIDGVDKGLFPDEVEEDIYTV